MQILVIVEEGLARDFNLCLHKTQKFQSFFNKIYSEQKYLAKVKFEKDKFSPKWCDFIFLY